ncbi:polymorphic toxin-type HINT domain-containing protein [Streptomyces cellulosae]|uniref:Polymorphic toxin-type HINT domain-containing protein n=1 Tax=Streptomyces cellulosae TaxID=1968 RepID=A0ABW7XXG4_STRCE
MPAVALALLAPAGPLQSSAVAEGGGLGRPDVPKPRASKVHEMKGLGAKKAREKVAKGEKVDAAQARRAAAEEKATWPKPDTATIRLASDQPGTADLGGTPVAVQPGHRARTAPAAGNAQVTVLDQSAAHKAGVTGVLLTAAADSAGRADISVDYADFASAIGGGWAQRLRLVQLPACALTTPQKAECRQQTPLKSDNDLAKQSVSAQVQLPEAQSDGPTTQSASKTDAPGVTVLAVTAASAGSGQSPKGTGDYSATALSAASSWQAGGSSGAFTWNYDFGLPPAAAGPAPTLGLSYDSGSIDGETANTNNQGSAVGEGFTLTESYIERSYVSCDEDGDDHDKVYDRCWKYDNARLVLNGKATRLIKDAQGKWHLEDDDASTVIRSTGADNVDDNGEYWTITTSDGTKYVFGLNKLDGAGDQRTNSTWTVPVFGDDSGEPGYDKGSAFAGRALTQAWRWNLDYVEDTRGNAATYWYTKESNYYKKNKSETANASYTRGGYLKEIKYGLRKDALFTDDADAKVTFSHDERCTVGDCNELTKDRAEHWPDVPFDAICTDGDTDCNAAGPVFFSRKRLTSIETYSWDAAGKQYAPVDSWALTEDYLDAGDIGDTTDHVLVLKSIKHTGKAGTAIDVKPITFTYQLRPNRVDGTDDILPLKRHRIGTITSETGAITTVTLSQPECKRSEVLGAAQDTNTRSCYPQFWNINGATEASVDWFNKYRVLAVNVADPAEQNELVEYAYDYEGAAWHYDDDPFAPKNERTWSQWRGYRDVTVRTGATDTARLTTVSRYLQGMHGDKKKDGATKTVSVDPLLDTDIDFSALTDSDPYDGRLLQEVTYNGTQPISTSYTDYTYKNTATQSVPDAADHTARWIRPNTSYESTYLTAPKAWRTHVATTRYDDLGMVREVDDYGQKGVGGDETCTRNWYARNTDAGIIGLVARTRTVAKECTVADSALDLPTDDSRRGDVLSDTATAYDNATWSESMKPSKGLPTWAGRAKAYSGGAPNWQLTATTAYDTLGRPTAITNADQNQKPTTTVYTPADAGPLTKTVVTNPLGHKTTSFLDPRRSQPLRTYDVNLNKTELTYDALGRLTQVWLPNRSSASQSPSKKFTYTISNTKQSSVSTSTLKKDGETYSTSYAIFDALLRPLQTQSETSNGGRLLTDTRYDSRGLVYETQADIFDKDSMPNGTYTRAEYGEAPTQTATEFDGAGRPTVSTLLVYGVKKWSTTTSYTGDSTATTATDGGSATRTITDIRGRTVESREYAGTSPNDTQYGASLSTSYTSTKFAYTPDGLQKLITGPDDAKWSYTYDLFGRKVKTVDPDAGTSTTGYDVLDRVVKSTDSRNKSVLTDYDALDRITGTWAGTKSDATQLTAATYDTLQKGLPDTSTRYIGGKNGQAYTNTVTDYDVLSRPTITKLDLPTTDPFVKAGATSTLEFETDYNLDGTIKYTKEPALGGLPSEIVDYGYNSVGDITSVGGSTGYLLDAGYSPLGEPQRLVLGTAISDEHKKSYIYNKFEEGTGRLTRSFVKDDTHGYMAQDLNYTYDQAGNVTSIADSTDLGGASSPETQCFAYDGHRRLTQAWTPSTQKCTDQPSTSSLSGPAPYWTNYDYNKSGQRTTETVHRTTGDTKTTYCYTKTDQTHFLTGTTTKNDCTSPEKTYTPDAAGNTTKRPGAVGTQDLKWSDEGKLSTLTESGKTTDYLYGADGTLLIRNAQGGERILYAGATELHLRANGTTWAQRHYAAAGQTIAVRSNETGTNKLTYLAGDHHGTQSLAITADSTQSVSKRYFTPFGAERAKPVGTAWPDDKGFLGKTNDKTTGLTHVGAREYDPAIGQFISVDPVLNSSDPQQLNGYAYSNNNPVTLSDPTGLCPRDLCPSGGQNTNRDYPGAIGGPPASSGGHGSNRAGGGGGSGGSGAATVKQQVVTRLIELGPTTYDEDTLLRYYTARTSALSGGLGDYWDTGVGEGDRLAMACYGRDGCTRARAYLLKTHDVAGAKYLAATYCLEHAKRCASNANYEKLTSDLMQESLELIALGMGGGKYGCKCFLAGTDVLMADKATKNIEDVKVGDKVLATDPRTGKTVARKVTRLIRTDGDKYFNRISIATRSGIEKITATREHPFWSPSEEKWIAAGELRAGMTLRTDTGAVVVVTSNSLFTRHARTYNLTVDDLHTYYVLAGQTPVLVHNSGGCLPALRDWSSQRFQFGNQAFLLDKKGMEHILTRHHPKYWDGSVKKTQSFFDSSMSVDDVQGAIGQVMRQNRDTLVQRGSQGMYQIRGNVNGVNYVLGMNRGRVGQFYPE